MGKVLRGKILRFLYDVRPRIVQKIDVFDVFYEYHKTSDIEKELDYLSSKGYLEKKVSAHPYKQRKKIYSYKITPEGVNLIEGLSSDIGVSVIVEEED